MLPYVDCISQSQTGLPFGYDPFLTRYRGLYHVLPVIYHPFHTCYLGRCCVLLVGYHPFLTRYRGLYHVLPVIYHPVDTGK
jgi:hypothetical protein